tara:strand:+ start:1110 stop:1259 length:150 start_codon:yes stop_codon:yes gene_type:complete
MKGRVELWETKGYYKPALVEVRLWLKSAPVVDTARASRFIQHLVFRYAQ